MNSQLQTQNINMIEQYNQEIERKGQVFQNMNKKRVELDESSCEEEYKKRRKKWVSCEALSTSERNKKAPYFLVDFPTTYLGMMKSIFTR